MESYEVTVLRRIGYVLFLIVLAVYIFDIGGSNAETAGAQAVLENLLP
jgi:hypothetical protein